MQTDLAKRVNRLLYGSHGGLNLKRPDIAALTKGQTVCGPIEVYREIEEVMLEMSSKLSEKFPKEILNDTQLS